MLLGIKKQEIEDKYDDIVEFSGLKRRIDKPVKTYSSGMRARLGFSIAAILQPDVFIIDEALSTGDLEFRQKATERIQEMMERAKAVIIVSHSMKLVEQICTRAIWIEQGRVKADGNAEQVVDKYRTTMDIKKPKKRLKRRTQQQSARKKKMTATMERKATTKNSKQKKNA